jgi:heme-degrading monooxygenase HmoA
MDALWVRFDLRRRVGTQGSQPVALTNRCANGKAQLEVVMPSFLEMDKHSPLAKQLELEVGPVVLINTLVVNADEAADLVKAWAADAAWMKRQPGFISTQLHRGIGPSGVFLNYAVWESTDSFKRAFTHPEFQSHLGDYPASTVVSPHLFQKVGVPGICVA